MPHGPTTRSKARLKKLVPAECYRRMGRGDRGDRGDADHRDIGPCPSPPSACTELGESLTTVPPSTSVSLSFLNTIPVPYSYHTRTILGYTVTHCTGRLRNTEIQAFQAAFPGLQTIEDGTAASGLASEAVWPTVDHACSVVVHVVVHVVSPRRRRCQRETLEALPPGGERVRRAVYH